MARSRIVVALLALFATGALAASDRTLGTVSGPCKDQFDTIMKEQYASDAKCSDLLKAAMSTSPKSPADCPGGAVAEAGSDVQKCMSKNQATKDAWVAFIKQCEVMNVNERTGAGEAEAAADAKPSCFPRFNSLSAFQGYIDSNAAAGSAKSAAGAAKIGALLATAAAAGAALLL